MRAEGIDQCENDDGGDREDEQQRRRRGRHESRGIAAECGGVERERDDVARPHEQVEPAGEDAVAETLTRKCTAPPAGEYRTELGIGIGRQQRDDTPIAKASHMALPAACATTPRIEKIPAPTIPPMPIETAAAMPIWPAPEPAEAVEDLVVPVVPPPARAAVSVKRYPILCFSSCVCED